MFYFLSIVMMYVIYRLYKIVDLTESIDFSYFLEEDLPEVLPCY